MKKLMRIIPIMLIALIGITAWSCSDDKDETILSDQLPTTAKTFIATYFPSPALTKNEDGTIAIDETMCNGCGLCKQLCKFDAIDCVAR